MRAVCLKTENGIETDKDLLDWLKIAQSETDGIKLDLADLADAQSRKREALEKIAKFQNFGPNSVTIKKREAL